MDQMKDCRKWIRTAAFQEMSRDGSDEAQRSKLAESVILPCF